MHFNSVSLDILGLRIRTEASNLGTFSRRVIILLHAVYTDCTGGMTDAVARHVILAQITCNVLQFSTAAYTHITCMSV